MGPADPGHGRGDHGASLVCGRTFGVSRAAASLEAAEAAGAAVGCPEAPDRALVFQLHGLMWSYPYNS